MDEKWISKTNNFTPLRQICGDECDKMRNVVVKANQNEQSVK